LANCQLLAVVGCWQLVCKLQAHRLTIADP
jgi:hypothetical protein